MNNSSIIHGIILDATCKKTSKLFTMASRLVAAPGISPSNVFTINYNDEGHDNDGDEGNDAESTGDYSLSSRVRLNKGIDTSFSLGST